MNDSSFVASHTLIRFTTLSLSLYLTYTNSQLQGKGYIFTKKINADQPLPSTSNGAEYLK